MLNTAERESDRVPANPTNSKVWTVLEHRDGGLEVWDCEAFGPWRLVAGPFDSYVEASHEYRKLARCRLFRVREEQS